MTSSTRKNTYQTSDSLQQKLYSATKQFGFTFLGGELTAHTRQAMMFIPEHLLGAVQDHLSGEQALDLHPGRANSNGKTGTGIITLHAPEKQQLDENLAALTLCATLADIPAFHETRGDSIRIFIFTDSGLPLSDMTRYLESWISRAGLRPEVDAFINDAEAPLPYFGANSCPDGLGATHLRAAGNNRQIPVHELYMHIRHATTHALAAFDHL